MSKKHCHIILLLAIFWMAGNFPAFAAGNIPQDRIVLYFGFSKYTLDRSFLSNEESLARLHKVFSDETNLPAIERIDIIGGASPEGNTGYNDRLAMNRALSVKKYLLENYPRLDPRKINVYSIGQDWDGLAELVRNDPATPMKDDVLRIITGKSDSYAKNKALRSLGAGEPFRYVTENHFRYLRTGVILTFGMAESAAEAAPTLPENPETPELPEEEPVRVIPQPETVAGLPSVAVAERVFSSGTYRPYVALRTNLLFLAVGAPNLGVEIPVGNRFSVTADVAYAYWRINNLYALQTIQGGVEGKYWFDAPRERPLTGWNAGVYAMYCSRYDVQWKDGYQGDGFWSAGISGGYSLPVSKRLNLEFSLAAGYFFTPEARHYSRPRNGRLIWEETRYDVGKVSLTKARVSLVWLIGK